MRIVPTLNPLPLCLSFIATSVSECLPKVLLILYLLRCSVDSDNQDSTDTFADPTLLENLHVNHVRLDCRIINLIFVSDAGSSQCE